MEDRIGQNKFLTAYTLIYTVRDDKVIFVALIKK